jgi:protein-S-isoprenylcysteine O-methyltransferase Ste14
MYLTGSIFIYAEAVAFEHLIILVYAAIVSLLQHLGVVFLEEPALRERFGESFQRYCDEVPRWLPRLRPATVNSGAE